VVVTNNYRASCGAFPGLDGSTIIVEAPQTNRQVLVDYILASGTLDPQADSNWGFTPIDGEVDVVFDTAPTAVDAGNAAQFEYVETLESGFARYRIPMSQ
jgi:2',3'-cyclic-nucleotide 2'-phosphodiesterase/3'-nucleotidase